MDNSFKFFKNTECSYYPCHNGVEELNCLFCYCPMYKLENCPGNYKIIEKEGKRIKSCIDCNFPHVPENYEKVMEILRHNNDF